MQLISSFQFANLKATSELISSGNQNRVALHIQNKSGGSVYFRFGSPISTEQGVIIAIEIPANGDYICDRNCSTDQIFMRGDDVLVGNNIVFWETSKVD